MSLFEQRYEQGSKVAGIPVLLYPWRNRAGRSAGDLEPPDTEEFGHSLELLRNTSLHLSLFKIILSDLKPPEAAGKVMRHAFGNRGDDQHPEVRRLSPCC